MKRGLSICFSVLLAIFGMLLVIDGNDADAGPFDLFVGEWACNTHLAEGSQDGGVAGIIKFRIDSWGNVSGTGFSAVRVSGEFDRFVQISSTGNVTHAFDGFISILTTITYEGGEPFTGRIACIGMTKSPMNGFQEMQCIDIIEDFSGTEDSMTTMQCKRIY